MDSSELYHMWEGVCSQVKSYGNVDASQINAFFSRLAPQAMSEGFLMLTADNDFIKSWVERHYLESIKQALNDLYHVPFNVFIEVDAAATESAAAAAPTAVAEARTNPPAAGQTSVPAPAGASAGANATAGGEGAGANAGAGGAVSTPGAPAAGASAGDLPKPSVEAGGNASGSPAGANTRRKAASEGPTSLTFENFVIGDSNRMAYSMAVAVAEMPGKAHLNPLFIYGKSGLGKTHLLRAIQNYIRETQPNTSTVYVDSAELLSDYMEASAAHDKEKSSYKNFKNRYEEADVLLIDDVQYLQGKKQTLDIVFQIFNKMTDQGKQVVLSADRAPKNIDIDERYKSRFNSGGTFDIQPPEIETKLGIVKSFVDEYRENEGSESFSIPLEIEMYIAENSSSNIRELKSAVTKIIYQMTFFNQPDLSLEDARSLLESHFSGGPSKRLTVADVQREVENYYKISHSDLVGRGRQRNVNYARKMAIYLCRQLLDLPFANIGEKFNRDHSTIMHLVNDVEGQLKESRDMNEEIESLKTIIREI